QVHLLSHFSTQPDALIQAQDLLFASRSFVVSATTDSAINSLQRLRLDALERGATDEATHLQLAIERHRAELGVSRNNQATLLSTAEIQAGLLADEVVLSLNRSHFGTTLFLLRPDSLQTVSLPDAESIEADVAILLRSASERGRFDYPSATRLGQLFLGPVLAHRQVRKIYWFPDELTNNIPFAALNIGTAERYQPAITRFTTSLIPAFRHNLLTMPEPDSIAVLSAALPDAWEPASGADEIRTWSATAQPLLWAGREVAEIVRLFNTRKPLVFTNQQASIEALQALKNTDIIHIASHGYVSQQDQDLAGLVLYGDGGEPQFVGWRSFSALNLNSRLVFLNGCQTARGEAIQGNGVYGLARGFLESGAHNVLATRWNISDRSAFRLTQAFYQQLKSGQGISESLRQAQATLYSSPQFRDPYYWASYALYSQKKSL
ncbi:MAG: CHAT domain-containing protein, partial [Pseudomonadales bacterium]|nr:CHAT domain-containing protein [Pseudomonadales bacterium]